MKPFERLICSLLLGGFSIIGGVCGGFLLNRANPFNDGMYIVAVVVSIIVVVAVLCYVWRRS